MRKNWLVLVVAGLMVAALVGSAAAQGRGTKAPCSQGRRFVGKEWAGKYTFDPRRRLNLTAEQKEKIADLRLTFKEETLELRAELRKKNLELQKLLLKESPDVTRVYGLVDEMAPIQAEIRKKTIEFWLNLKSLLTREQLDKLPGLGSGWGFSRAISRRGAMGGCWR